MSRNAKTYLKENKFFLVLLAIFLVTKLLLLFEYHLVIWDEAVYIGMGKYLFSGGQVGLWEPIRPVLWPWVLGFFWKIKLSPVFWGELLTIILSTGILWLTYHSGKKIFNKNTGLISVVLLGITPVFYLYSNWLLTEIPAAFFILLSLYFLLKERYWLAGLFSGLVFLTKFPAGLIIAGIGGVFLIKFYLKKEKKEIWQPYWKYLLAFGLAQIPFLVFNLLIYHTQTPVLVAIFRPYILAFSHQSNIFEAVGGSGWWSLIYNYLFYLIELIKENWLLAFFFLGLGWWIYKKDYKNYNKNMIFVPLLFFLAYFSFIINKQLRFSLIFLPWFCLVAADGLNQIYERLKRTKKVIYLIAFFIIFLALTTTALSKDLTYTGWRHKSEPVIAGEYYKFLVDKEAGLILTADPVPAAYVDTKFGILYHDLDTAIKEYSKNINEADYIIYFNDFYPCLDKKCELKKETLFKYIAKNKLVFNKTYDGREYLIFKVI